MYPELKEIKSRNRLLYRFKYGGEVKLPLTIVGLDGEARRFIITLDEKKGVTVCQRVR